MISERLDNLISKIDRADAVRQSLINQKGDLLTRLSEREEYLDNKDEVTEALLEIQKSMQSGMTESYETLLTELLHIIMPDDPSNHRVVMTHFVKNNTVALRTEIETQDGYRHDIYENKGRSVENIMALCLRFLALGRTANRRVLLFDESDHGIEPKHMGKFAEVLYQLTYRIGMQVIYISHHDWKLFEGKARVIKLAQDGETIDASVISDISPDTGNELNCDVKDYMSGVGITDITLKNYKAHESTRVELCPFLNIIIGSMDLGKSTIISAMDALKRNKGSQNNIRDGQREFEVELGLEEGRRLAWSYSMDSPKKAKYVLYDASGHPIDIYQGAKEIPSFMDTYLAMPLHRGYDLHIADEHDSSFVFAKGVSEAKAAEILSFDEETTQAQELLVQHRDNVVNYKREVRALTASINAIKSKLTILSHLDKVPSEMLRNGRQYLREEASRPPQEAGRLGREILIGTRSLKSLDKLKGMMGYPPPENALDGSLPVLAVSIDRAMRSLKEFNRLQKIVKYPERHAESDYDLGRIASSIDKLQKMTSILSSLVEVPLPAPPNEDTELRSMIESLSSLNESLKETTKKGNEIDKESSQIDENIRQSIHINGGVCPLCQSKI